MTTPAELDPRQGGLLAGPIDADDTASVRAANEFVILLKTLLGALVQEVDLRLAAHGLTAAQWMPVVLLAEGRCRTAAEISRHCNCDAGALARTMARLEKKGLLRRVRSTQDRRVVELHPTAAGSQAAALVPGILAEMIGAHRSNFAEDEWQDFTNLLVRMKTNGAAAPGP